MIEDFLVEVVKRALKEHEEEKAVRTALFEAQSSIPPAVVATDSHVDGPAPEITATVEAASAEAVSIPESKVTEIHQNRNLSGTVAPGAPR